VVSQFQAEVALAETRAGRRRAAAALREGVGRRISVLFAVGGSLG
jgi:hypothetical protein